MTTRRKPTTYQALARKAAQEGPTLILLQQIDEAGLPAPVREYLFAKPIKRRWRADLAYPEERVLIEIEGGVYSGGRHVRGKGYEDDCEKYSWANLLGYCLLRFTTGQIARGEAVPLIQLALQGEMTK